MSEDDPDFIMAGDVARQIYIPPKPELLDRLQHELDNDDLELTVIADLIKADVALSAAVLKLINSSYFYFQQQITSISHAVSLLGMKPTVNLVTGFLLKRVYDEQGIQFPRFWDTAARVANLAAFFSARLRIGTPDEAYLSALFQDAGIPLMARVYANYKQTLHLANASVEGLFTDIEDERYNINHTQVGSMVCREWGIPALLNRIIANHHDTNRFDSDSGTAQQSELDLAAVVKLSELAELYLRMGCEDGEWQRFRAIVGRQLSLDQKGLMELVKEGGGTAASERGR